MLTLCFYILIRYKDRKLLYSGRHYGITVDEDVHTLTIHDAFPDDTGRYMCRAVNVVGSTTTEAYVKVQSKYTLLSLEFFLLDKMKFDHYKIS